MNPLVIHVKSGSHRRCGVQALPRDDLHRFNRFPPAFDEECLADGRCRHVSQGRSRHDDVERRIRMIFQFAFRKRRSTAMLTTIRANRDRRKAGEEEIQEIFDVVGAHDGC
jgi:hypothetical protein